MANNVTNPRFWKLDTAGVIKAVGVPVHVRFIYYVPAAADNAANIQEYLATDGSLVDAAYIKAGTANATPVSKDFGPDGRYFNGFKLESITAGTLYIDIIA